MPTAKSQAVSLGLHVFSIALLLLVASRSLTPPGGLLDRETHSTQLIAPRLLRIAVTDRGGGANESILPARRGNPPPRAAKTFIPPEAKTLPHLEIPMGVAFDVPLISDARRIGDPLSTLAIGSLGKGGHNGIGDGGCCDGVGPSRSGPPGWSSQKGHAATQPELLYKVEPEFSEEARKAKYQGTVLLSIQVDETGHPRSLTVVQAAGLGLDQKAIEAVTKWRFRPGMLDGKPVVTNAVVEVNFRLM